MPAAASTQGQALPVESRGGFRARRAFLGQAPWPARLAPAVASGARAVSSLVAGRWPEIGAALVAILVYLPSVGFGFVFDDGALIAPDGSPLPLGAGVPYRPLRYASYLLDSWLGGTAAVYHLHNVLLHAAVVVLVVAIARRLGSSRIAALGGGVLVATHPLAVEAAAYISGRRDLLCVGLGLAAVLAHLKGRLAAALGLVVLSAAAKESGLVFAAPLALATLSGLGTGLGIRPGTGLGADPGAGPVSMSRPGAGSLAAIAATAAAALAMTIAYGAIGPWVPATGVVGLALPGRVAAHYLGALAGLRELAPEYPELLQFVERVQGGDTTAALSGSMATVMIMLLAAASIALCARAGARRRDREAAFVFAWVMAVIAALASWAGLHEPGADRHAYLLLAPLGVAMAVLLSQFSPHPVSADGAAKKNRAQVQVFAKRKPVPVPDFFATFARGLVVIAVGAGLVVSASSSRRQMEIWRGERSLWSHATASPAASPRAHSNMARVLASDGSYRAAARHMNAALAGAPGDSSLYVGRAALRCAQGRRFLARRDLHQARRLGADAAMLAGVTRDCVPEHPAT